MRLTPYSFNNFLFQQTDRVSADFLTPYDWGIGGMSTNNIARNEEYPKYSGKIFGGGVKVVNVVLNCVNVDRDALVIAMDIKGTQQHPFYATDELGNLWYVNVVAVGLNFQSTSDNTANFGYVLECDDPTWEMVTEQTDTWNIVGSTATKVITCPGNQPNYATFEYTPTFPFAAYYTYHQYVKNYNPIPAAQNDAIDITNGGWDTHALVLAGKMLPTGDDCRVFCDGVEVPRWVGGGGWNNAATKIIIKRTWLPGHSLVLKTAIVATGIPAKMYFTSASKTALSKLPVRGMLRIGTEEFSYKNRNTTALTVDIVDRPIRDTVAAIHAIGATVWWVEHNIVIVYGYAGEDAPVYNNSQMPLWNLTTGTNTSRPYALFADLANMSVGRWVRQMLNPGLGNQSRTYSGNEGAADEVDPATEMGMEIANYDVEGRSRPETAELAWLYYHPAGIATVTSNGEKWRAFATTLWPVRASLESSPNGKKPWGVSWNEATPVAPASWATTWSHPGVAMPSGTKYVRFHFWGSINALVGNIVRFEPHAVTVTLTAANVIQVGMHGEVANYYLYAQVTNVTTGQSFTINHHNLINKPLIVDTKNIEVTYRGVNAFPAITLDAIRTEILPLQPGPNTIVYTALSPAAGNVTMVSRIHARSQ